MPVYFLAPVCCVFLFCACYSPSPGLSWEEERSLNQLGLMTPREADEICTDLVSRFANSKNFDDWVMNNEHGPIILCAELVNMSTEWIDTQMIDKSLSHAILQSGKGTAVSTEGAAIVIPAWQHGRFLSSQEQESLEIIDKSGCDMVLTGTVKTSIFSKNLNPIRNYYVELALYDAADLSELWKGRNNELNKAVRAGPVRRAFYRNDW
jgi:hypothetical protein